MYEVGLEKGFGFENYLGLKLVSENHFGVGEIENFELNFDPDFQLLE